MCRQIKDKLFDLFLMEIHLRINVGTETFYGRVRQEWQF